MARIQFRLNGVKTDKDVMTVEGLGSAERPHVLQRALIAEQALQCGYCISGILMASPLPRGCEPATMYAAGVTAEAESPQQAQALIDLLTSPRASRTADRAGFVNG
jgi:xanthine dehydrogenase iron-sulfur cluster and FAD-binding subunit A